MGVRGRKGIRKKVIGIRPKKKSWNSRQCKKSEAPKSVELEEERR
jgi:hypothetical protein